MDVSSQSDVLDWERAQEAETDRVTASESRGGTSRIIRGEKLCRTVNMPNKSKKEKVRGAGAGLRDFSVKNKRLVRKETLDVILYRVLANPGS